MGKENQAVAAAKPDTAASVATPAPAAATAVAPAAKQDAAAPAAKKEASGKGKLYEVASPIKHDGEDYAVGDEIRLPEATAHRLAGYLKA